MHKRVAMTGVARRVEATTLRADEREIEAALAEVRAVLADLDFAHRAALERLDAWDGPEVEKRLIADELERRTAAARLAYEERLAELEARRDAYAVVARIAV